MKIPVYLFTRPSNISMVATALSFGAWAFPSFGVLRKGFDKPAAVDLVAILVLAAWYALIFISFRTGEFFGKSPGDKFAPPSETASLDANAPYYIFTIIAAVGVLAAAAKIIASISLSGAVDYVLSGNANQLKEALYDEYHIGLVSLRYVVAYPAAIALYRLVTRRRLSLSIVLNLLLLVICALIASRLLLIATVLTTILLLNVNCRYRKVRFPRILLISCILFTLLSVFNYSRNYWFYENLELGFWSSGFAEIIAYLGGSSQVALGTAARTSDLVSGHEETYRGVVDIQEELNAPSAFVVLHEQMGYWCWLYIGLVCGFAGFVFSRLVGKGKTAYLLPCGVILYAAADLWRINMFGLGIFITLMVVGIGVPWFLTIICPAAVPKGHQQSEL